MLATLEHIQSQYSSNKNGLPTLSDQLCLFVLKADVQQVLAEDYFSLEEAFKTLLTQQENETEGILNILLEFPSHLSVSQYFTDNIETFHQQVSC